MAVGESIVVRLMSQSGFLFLHKHHDQEASWGGKGLFSLHFHTAVDHQRKSGLELTQGKNLEAGANAEAMEECCLVACFPWLAQLALLQNPRLPAHRWYHPQWTYPFFEKMPNSWISWRHFLKGGSFPCDNSSLCQVDTQNQPVHTVRPQKERQIKQRGELFSNSTLGSVCKLLTVGSFL